MFDADGTQRGHPTLRGKLGGISAVSEVEPGLACPNYGWPLSLFLRIDARGYRTTYSFSPIDQQTGRRYPDGSRVTFVYDPVGNRLKMQDSTGRYTYSYDQLSRTKSAISPPNHRITYAYDAISQRSVMTAPTGFRFTYSYDAAQRINRIINPEGDRTTYAYDAASRRLVKKLANGARASFTYDTVDNLTVLANMQTDGSYISRYDYRYDPTGNRYAVLEADGSRVTWLSDGTYRLTGENRTGTSPYRNTFSYDSRGNRTLKNESGARTTYAYDAANQLRYGDAASGRTTYLFDADGNQRSFVVPSLQRTTFLWTFENYNTRVIPPTSARITALYSADNCLVSRESPTEYTGYIFDNAAVLAFTDATESIVARLDTEPTIPPSTTSIRTSLGTLFFHSDCIGTLRNTSNSAGSVVGSTLFDAWGNQLLVTGSVFDSVQWVGEFGYIADGAFGGYHAGERNYTPATARWTSKDRAYPGIIIQPFVYAKNSPLVYIDSTGLEAVMPGKARQEYENRKNAAALLENYRRELRLSRHKYGNMNQCLVKAFSVDAFFKSLIDVSEKWVTSIIENSTSNMVSGAASFSGHTLSFPGTMITAGITLIHETVHAWDTMLGLNLSIGGLDNVERAESMAYSAEYLLEALERLDQMMLQIGRGSADCKGVLQNAEQVFSRVGSSTITYTHRKLLAPKTAERPLTLADLTYFSSYMHLGNGLSCNKIMQCFQRYCPCIWCNRGNLQL